jgi:hypothetical protein
MPDRRPADPLRMLVRAHVRHAGETKYAAIPFRNANARIGQRLPITKYLEK